MNDVHTSVQGSAKQEKLPVKHLTLRLPCGPDFMGESDESRGLTVLRAMRELMEEQRFTIHALICQIVDAVPGQAISLPHPKRPVIPTGASHERLDLRLTQSQLDIVDALRDAFDVAGVMDPREYYSRPDVIRELLWTERRRVQEAFLADSPFVAHREAR